MNLELDKLLYNFWKFHFRLFEAVTILQSKLLVRYKCMYGTQTTKYLHFPRLWWSQCISARWIKGLFRECRILTNLLQLQALSPSMHLFSMSSMSQWQFLASPNTSELQTITQRSPCPSGYGGPVQKASIFTSCWLGEMYSDSRIYLDLNLKSYANFNSDQYFLILFASICTY